MHITNVLNNIVITKDKSPNGDNENLTISNGKNIINLSHQTNIVLYKANQMVKDKTRTLYIKTNFGLCMDQNTCIQQVGEELYIFKYVKGLICYYGLIDLKNSINLIQGPNGISMEQMLYEINLSNDLIIRNLYVQKNAESKFLDIIKDFKLIRSNIFNILDTGFVPNKISDRLSLNDFSNLNIEKSVVDKFIEYKNSGIIEEFHKRKFFYIKDKFYGS